MRRDEIRAEQCLSEWPNINTRQHIELKLVVTDVKNKNIRERKLTIKDAFAKLRARNMSFVTMKAALHYYRLPTSTGWGGAQEKLAAVSDTAKALAANITKLDQIYRDNIRFGNKAVQLVFLPQERASLLRAFILYPHEKTSAVANVGPSPISTSNLPSLSLLPQVNLVTKEDGDLTFYFYARGYVTEKEQFDVDLMSDAASKTRFSGFDHVIAYRQRPYLRVDTVVVNLARREFQFRLDMSQISSLEQAERGLAELKTAFHTYLQTVDKEWENVGFELANLYPKIELVYNTTSGMVVRLGHNTGSGAINHEKMRGLKGDLREEMYHKAGKGAVTTQSFSITTSFPYDDGYSRVHLSIPGKSAQASALTPTLSTAIIEDCFRQQQFEDMVDILR